MIVRLASDAVRLHEALQGSERFEVFLATCEGRPAVAKRVSARSTYVHGPLKLLEHEYRVLERLRHPAIPRPYGLWTDPSGSATYLVMERKPGRSLAEVIAAGVARNGGSHCREWSDTTKDIVHQLGAALAYLHDAGLLHNDIKPDNVLVDACDGFIRVALIDYESSGATHAGTMPYAAPERLDGRPVGERSDVYSLALVVFELLTGVRPFTALDPKESLREKRSWPNAEGSVAAAAVGLGRLRDLPGGEELWRRLKPALLLSPATRPPGVRAFLRALDPALAVPSQGDGPGPLLAVALVALATALLVVPLDNSLVLRWQLGRPDLDRCIGRLQEVARAVCREYHPTDPHCRARLESVAAPVECPKRMENLQKCLRRR